MIILFFQFIFNVQQSKHQRWNRVCSRVSGQRKHCFQIFWAETEDRATGLFIMVPQDKHSLVSLNAAHWCPRDRLSVIR